MTKVTGAQIDAAIAKFTTDANKLKDQVHKVCMMMFYHGAPKELSDDCSGTGDFTRLPKFLAALPRGWSDGVKLWFETYTPVRVSTDMKETGYEKKTYKKLSPEDKLKWWNMAEANVNRFDELKAPQKVDGPTKVVGFDDVVKMAQGLQKRIEQLLAGDVKNKVVKDEDRLSLQAFALAVGNLKIEKIEAGAASNDAATGDEAQAA